MMPVNNRAVMYGAALMNYRPVVGRAAFMQRLRLMDGTRFMRGLGFMKRRVFVGCGFYLMYRTGFMGRNAVITGAAFLYGTDLLLLRRAFSAIAGAGWRRFGNAHDKRCA